jgi:hypothetical protein
MKNILIHLIGYVGLFILAQLIVLSVVGITPSEFLTDVVCLIKN